MKYLIKWRNIMIVTKAMKTKKIKKKLSIYLKKNGIVINSIILY